MRHIGRGAAHVKANHFVVTCTFCCARHAHNTACRTTQNSVFASKRMRIGQAARRLHEHQFDAWHFAGHLINIATQNGRQIGIHHRGVAAADKLHQGTGLMRGTDLREANVARQLRGHGFMLLVAIGMHEHNGHAANTGIKLHLQLNAQCRCVQGFNDIALCRHSLLGFNDFAVKQFRQYDVAVKQTRTILIRNAQSISKTLRGDQQGAFTFSL